MSDPVTLDQSTFTPLSPAPEDSPAQKLQQSVSFGAQQNPDQYAKLLKLKQQTGIPPQVAQGNEAEVQHAADVGTLDYPQMAVSHPRTTAWASNPDNAAVSGVDEITRLARMELARNGLNVNPMPRADLLDTMQPEKSLANYFFMEDKPLPVDVSGRGFQEGSPERRVQDLRNLYARHPELAMKLSDIKLTPANLVRGALDYATPGGVGTSAYDIPVGLGTLGYGAAKGDKKLALTGGAQILEGVGTALSAGIGAGIAEAPLRTTAALVGYQLSSEAAAKGAAAAGLSPEAQRLIAAATGLAPLGYEAFSHNAAVERLVNEAAESKLKARSPEAFHDAMQKMFEGDPSLKIPVEEFKTYFQSKGIEPQKAAEQLGVKNYPEAVLSGGHLEVPTENFLGKLDTEHQQGLLPDIVDPAIGLTTRQQQTAAEEIQKWAAEGGPEKLNEQMSQADTETQASDEYQGIKGQLKQQYIAAGETEPIADNYATLQANVYSNLARETGLKASELMQMYRPVIRLGEGPQGPSGNGTIVANVEPHPEGEVRLLDSPIQPRPDNGRIQHVAVSDLALAPERFQYKLNTDSTGVTNLLKGRKWNDQLADPITVWRDPEDGKMYVVNGHHRFQLAKENGVDSLWVKTLDVPTAEEARAVGALQNIAAGRGTAMDAAKFFRDTGITPDKLDALGISLGEATAAKGVALARLDPYIFDQVVSGKIREGRAVAIGNATSDPAEQESILKLIQRAEKKGKKVSDEVVDELARMVKGAGQQTESQDSLFGVQEMTRNLALEKAEISNAIREKIANERRVFQSVSQESKAVQLGKVEGQKIDAKKNAEVATQAAQAQELYDRLSTRGGQIDDILNGAAKELAKGGNANGIKERAYSAVRDELSKAISGSAAEGNSGVSETSQSTNPLFQRRNKISPEDSLSLPGMEEADTQRREAVAAALGEELTNELLKPKGSVNKASGEMERNSPLFKGTGDNPTLFQENRGWFRVLPDGSFEIGKTSIGDLSTFIHEPAHSYLFLMSELAKREGASEGLKSDYGKILEFLGAKDGEALTTEQHEKWARANEQYLREGKAPSPSLRGVFQRFAVWLTSIYKRASDLGVELSGDIRGVFDRMYAAEDGVNRAEKESGPQLFSTPEEAGWTPEQFQTYAESKGMEVEQAKSEILSKLNEAAVRERTDAWREEEKNTREAIAAEIDQRPEYQAIRVLRDGKLPDGTELKLNRDELVKRYGEDRVKALQEQHKGLYRIEGGVDADTAAEILGFDSGDEMLRKLTDTPRRAQAIEQTTREFMTAKHGDIRYDGTLNDQARIALENDKRAANLHKELKQLQKKLDETKAAAKDQKAAMRAIEVAPIEAYRNAAKEAIQAKSLADMQPTRYLDASRKFSREAFDALRSGKVDEAAQAKHKELMNHFLFREASEARDLGDKIEAYAKKMSTTKELGKLGLAGQPFLDQIQSFLSRYSFDRVRSLTNVPAPPQESLAQFADRMRTEEGLDLPIDPALLDQSQKKNYRSVPFSELEAVYDAMRSIEHAAKLVNSVRAEGKRVALQQAASDLNLKLQDSIGKPEVRKSSDKARSFLERVKDVNLDIAVLLPEFMFERFDGLSKTGPWHDFFWNRYNDAADHQNRLREMVFPEIMKFRSAKIDRSKKFYIQSIDRTLTKDDIISIALNSGNESNLEKQMKGGIQFEKDEGPTPINNAALHEILSHLTPDEIKTVNGIWKTIATLKPEAAALERKRTGIEPKWIEPKSLDIANGTLEGGYYPLKYDPRFSAAGEKQSDASTVQQMFTKFASSNTRQGYLKGRTQFFAPLTLDWQATVSRHLDEVTTDISHWEFATDAQRLLKNPDVKGSIIRNLGDAYYKNLLDWVRYTVNQDSMGREASDNIDKFRRSMRNNVSTAVLGFRVGNAVAEAAITPLLSVQHVSPESAFKGAMTFMRNPVEAMRFASEASDYMKRIDKEVDRDITVALNDLAGKTSLLDNLKRWSIGSRMYFWKMGAAMAWHAGYTEAMKQGMEGTDAVRFADSIYRMTQESGRPGDLSAVQRNPYMKELTQFIGPSLIQYNNYARAVRGFIDQGLTNKTAVIGMSTLFAAFANNVIFNLMRGKGPDDDKKWPAWLTARMTLGMLDGLPILRDFAGATEAKILGEHGKDFRLSPALQAGKDTRDALLSTVHAFEGSEAPGKAVKQNARAVGDLTGLPAVQGSITGEYIYDVLSGNYKPAHPWSPITDAVYARPKKAH